MALVFEVAIPFEMFENFIPTFAPWLVMLAYGLIVWQFAPKRVTIKGFFTGTD